jgi:predicted dehydrogenase
MSGLKWGLVGYGVQAKRMVAALRKIKEVEIISVCCSSEERTIAAEKELGVHGYGKLSEFLDDREIEVVYIASPHQLHTPQAFKAVEAGKHVLVEKPMSLSVDGAHKLIDIAHKKNVMLGANFPLRQHPALRELHEEIKNDRLGDITQVYVQLGRKNPQAPGWWHDQFHAGPMCLMDLGVQGLDLLIWLVAQKAIEVSTIGWGGRDDQALNVSVAVSAYFGNGAQGMVSSTNVNAGEPNLVMVQGSQEQATVEMNWPEGDGAFRLRRRFSGHEEEKRFEALDLDRMTAQNFCMAVSEKIKYNPCCEETYPVVECCCAAIESLRSGRAVRVGEIFRTSGSQYYI